MYENSTESLHDYLVSDSPHYGKLMGSLSRLATWHERQFIVSAFEGRPDPFALLHKSFAYELWSVRIEVAYNIKQKHKAPMFLFGGHGLLMCTGFALGCFESVDRLGQLIISNVDRKWYVDIDNSGVAYFILCLYCLWKEITPPAKERFAFMPQCYKDLLSTWKDENFESLECSLMQACDLHIQQSRYDTLKVRYDFNDTPYWVFPGEILGLLQLRKKLGLRIPELKHPLMQLQTAVLPNLEGVHYDELLEKVKTKSAQELEIC